MTTTMLVIPTLDEAGSITTLLARVRAVSDADVLVVDDGSTDGTAELAAAAGATVLQRGTKLGLASAYRDGFARALAGGYDLVGQMDADLSHPPEALPVLTAAVRAGADVALGSRYRPGGATADWSARRRALSRAANTYVRLATGCPVRDATAGYRVWRASALWAIAATEGATAGYAFQVENTLRAWQLGLSVVEAPITFVERAHGASKMSRATVVEAATSVAAWAVRVRGGRSLVPVPAAPAPVGPAVTRPVSP